MEGDILKAALEYAKKGLSVIQIGGNKHPIISTWKEFQERKATEEEILQWFKWLPNSNIGIITGKISGITVVDVEAGGDLTKWPETFTVKTGGGGYHLYYKYYEGVRNGTRICELTDIRSEGGLVVAPPSIHQSGNRYEVIKRIPMVEFPIDILNSLKKSNPSPVITGDIWSGVSSGSRNEMAAKVSGILLKVIKREDLKTGWEILKSWNHLNNPPLDEQELLNVYRSISNREATKIGIEAEGETDVVHISEAITSEEYTTPTPIGYRIFDEAMLGGVREGDLVILTGKSGEGKTTLAQNITLNLTFKGGLSTWFSYEVIPNNLYAKFKQMAQASNSNISDLAIFMPKRTNSGNISWIKEKISESIKKYNSKFIFIDHIDFISPTNIKSGDQRRMILKDICLELKSLALELKVCIFLIAHVKKVQGREIEMQDIAESSGIYQLADFVFSVQRLYRKDKVDGNYVEVATEESIIKLLKNRLTGEQPYMKFTMNNNII
jgi:replicative DNA helicase